MVVEMQEVSWDVNGERKVRIEEGLKIGVTETKLKTRWMPTIARATGVSRGVDTITTTTGDAKAVAERKVETSDRLAFGHCHP